MNALVAVRTNAAGLNGPSPAERIDMRKRLADLPQAKPMAKAGPAPKAANASTALGGAGEGLDRDSFLQLLVLQLQNQDPMEPVDNSQMLAQLAQFTSLEQMNNLNENFVDLSGNVDQLNFISGSSMLGRQVRGIDLDGKPRQGRVDGIHLDGSVVVLSVDGGQMSMAGVTAIADEPWATKKD